MPRVRHHAAVLVALMSATMLAGCNATTGRLTGASDIKTASTSPVSVEALAELGRKWQANPADVSRGLAYANGLEASGQVTEQLDVYRRLAELNPGNGKVAGLYGRKLMAQGQAAQAAPILEAALQAGETDWRVLSALGSAYDQQGNYAAARGKYQQALAADPQNLVVLNNLGMSYALEGDLRQAEARLREADALPNARNEPRIRQNLALVVGLQGRFDEATKLAQDNLPPEQVEANMAYLKKMLSQPNTWQQISEGGQG